MEKNFSRITSTLQSIGLSDKETRVYIALLELGRGTVSQIARKSHINRTTTYDILASLIEMSIISISGKQPKQEYVAEQPEKIITHLEKKIQNNQAAIKKAHKLLPDLKGLQQKSTRPQVRFYEGTEGLKQAYEDTLSSHETIKAYANVDEIHKTLPGYFPKYYQRRTEKKIKIQAIFSDNQKSRERKSFDKQESRETALIPEHEYPFSPEINIYDNKVMIASWKEKLGIIIESKEIAEAMKSIYKLAWAEAQRLDKKIQNKKEQEQS
ncbi:MAG: hypothetical protein HOA84_03345 [Candidatus Jacksonbacteria bacterium]|nr:hypothetical protein [Candidatus Jacksonbacteria bacterium]MBT6757353.1 hypothetical protein [Candidatus Jacksonbacteria bacterium]MBT6954946.1 hypothetical protein [Candidatus Jacksonbacteria bacterium]